MGGKLTAKLDQINSLSCSFYTPIIVLEWKESGNLI